MLGVSEALRDLFESLQPLSPVEVEVDDAMGLVLAEPIVSNEIHPADDSSAMDGYALQSTATRGATQEHPVFLQVVEDIRAGYPPEEAIAAHQCSRVSTGGLLPCGADAVEMREKIRVLDDGRIAITQEVAPGSHVRKAGEHLKVGDEVVAAGTVLSSSELGMAAFLGYVKLRCYPRLKVAIAVTGSELVPGSETPATGQIRDSNGVALACAVKELGCEVSLRERVADQREAIDDVIARALPSSHVLLTTGGISAGWHDLVRGRIENAGGVFTFHKLRMRPGKPIAFGRIKQTWIFCLPGNPVSSLVSFEIFVKPALCKLMGRSWHPIVIQGRLSERLTKKIGLTVFFQVCLTQGDDGIPGVSLSGPQGSHQLKSFVAADGLLVCGEEIEEIPSGEMVEVRLFKDVLPSALGGDPSYNTDSSSEDVPF